MSGGEIIRFGIVEGELFTQVLEVVERFWKDMWQ